MRRTRAYLVPPQYPYCVSQFALLGSVAPNQILEPSKPDDSMIQDPSLWLNYCLEKGCWRMVINRGVRLNENTNWIEAWQAWHQ
jgi:hypothetical protein